MWHFSLLSAIGHMISHLWNISQFFCYGSSFLNNSQIYCIMAGIPMLWKMTVFSRHCPAVPASSPRDTRGLSPAARSGLRQENAAQPERTACHLPVRRCRAISCRCGRPPPLKKPGWVPGLSHEVRIFFSGFLPRLFRNEVEFDMALDSQKRVDTSCGSYCFCGCMLCTGMCCLLDCSSQHEPV